VAVFLAVAFEGVAGSVRGVAVEFGDQAPGGPGDVDFVALDVGVEVQSGENISIEEGVEAVLELLAGEDREVVAGPYDGLNGKLAVHTATFAGKQPPNSIQTSHLRHGTETPHPSPAPSTFGRARYR